MYTIFISFLQNHSNTIHHSFWIPHHQVLNLSLSLALCVFLLLFPSIGLLHVIMISFLNYRWNLPLSPSLLGWFHILLLVKSLNQSMNQSIKKKKTNHFFQSRILVILIHFKLYSMQLIQSSLPNASNKSCLTGLLLSPLCA